MRSEITVRGTLIGTFDEGKVLTGQMIRLEDETGYTLPELLEQVGRGSGRALQALVWFTQVLSGSPTPERFMEFSLSELVVRDLDEQSAEAEVGKAEEPDAPAKAVKAVKAA